MLLRPAAPGRQEGDTVEIKELAPHHEVFIIWNKEFQFKHDQWWDPLCPSRIHLDAFLTIICKLYLEYRVFTPKLSLYLYHLAITTHVESVALIVKK